MHEPLEKKIEKEKKKLDKAVEELEGENLTSLVDKSQKLDNLIVQYMRKHKTD